MWQRQHHCTGFHRIGEHSHGGWQRGQQLLGPVDPVKEPRHRPEGIVDRRVRFDRMLELLENRTLPACGVGVAGQQQNGQPIHCGQPRPGHQVQSPGTDGRRDRQRRTPPRRLGESDAKMHEGLLMAALHEGHQVAQLVQRLPHAGDVPVTEYA